MTQPVNAIAYGRTIDGDWVRLLADSQGRLRCRLLVSKDTSSQQTQDPQEVIIAVE